MSHIAHKYAECLPTTCCHLFLLTAEHTKWRANEGFADNLSKFSATIQGAAYRVSSGCPTLCCTRRLYSWSRLL